VARGGSKLTSRVPLPIKPRFTICITRAAIISEFQCVIFGTPVDPDVKFSLDASSSLSDEHVVAGSESRLTSSNRTSDGAEPRLKRPMTASTWRAERRWVIERASEMLAWVAPILMAASRAIQER
jgi:hypothetical protein